MSQFTKPSDKSIFSLVYIVTPYQKPENKEMRINIITINELRSI